MNKDIKKVRVPNYDRVPRWLVLQGEIDLRVFILKKMLANSKIRNPIEQMIDQATGFDKQLTKEAKDLIAELRYLKGEYDEEIRLIQLNEELNHPADNLTEQEVKE